MSQFVANSREPAPRKVIMVSELQYIRISISHMQPLPPTSR